ncbi:MAG: PDZ domain-containing protein [Planctomycetes bacterium]|nr:PDZ domain-containing protein [Planctomycetota bacterium]
MTALFFQQDGGKKQDDQDKIQSVDSESFELYAPNEHEYKIAKKCLDYVVKKFQKYFGEKPPKIAVRIFSSPQEMAKYDFTPYRKKKIIFLPWMSSEYFEDVMFESSYPAVEIGAMLAKNPKSGKIYVVQMVSGDVGTSLEQGDIINSLNGKAVKSMKQFRQDYEKIAPQSEIQLKIMRNGKQQVLSIIKSNPDALDDTQARVKENIITRISKTKDGLSHEAGHMFFIAYVDQKRGRSVLDKDNTMPNATGHYGHYLIPDWFDEMAATLLEYPSLQVERRAQMKGLTDKKISFEQFFSMKHPSFNSKENDMLTHIFYAEALTLAEFLIENDEPVLIKKIADKLIHGKKFEIEDFLKEIKSVPSDLEELEEKWGKWVSELETQKDM